MIVEAGVLAVGVAVISAVVSRVRARQNRRLETQSHGQSQALLPEGDFAAWPLRYLVAAKQPSLLRFRGGQVALFAPGSLQPEWQAPAANVTVAIVPPSKWVDVARVRLHPPHGAAMTLRVSRETRRPLGPMDARYEQRLGGYLASFVEAARRNGSPIT